MVTHFFTLYALCREAEQLLQHAVIDELFTQHKDELYISAVAGEKEFTLAVSVDPSSNYFLLRDRVSRAKKNSVDLFPSLAGKTIAAIGMPDFDRTIAMTFNDSREALLFQLYNSAKSNIFLVDARKTILHAFQHGKEHEGKLLPPPRQGFDMDILQHEDSWRTALAKDEGTIFNAVKKHLPIFGATYVREALSRAGVEEAARCGSLDGSAIAKIFDAVRTIYEERNSPRPHIYFEGDRPVAVSIIPLHFLSTSRAEPYDTVNRAVRTFLAVQRKSEHAGSEKKELLGKLKALLEKNERSMETLDRQAKESFRAAEYERTGSIIMGNLDLVTKGMTSVELPDIFTGAGTVNITLDPKLNSVKNAERYFEKAKKMNSASRESEARIRGTREESELLQKLLAQLEGCEEIGHVGEFIERHRKELAARHLVKEEKNREQPPFRIFNVFGGFEVWVGKSSANNDLLTMKYTKPNDLWFHARGSSGSHTVLKVKDADHPPAKEAVHQAASIAAYYSKMRKASNVPVAYCERKYVKKFKGLAEGAVILEREKVIFVTPRLPQGAQE